jgi:bacterioferritin-associated ferredoxin
MIVCSCNVFSDQQVRSALAKATQRQRMSQIYKCLGGSAQCGRCVLTIKRIMEQIANRSFVCVTASTNLHTRTQERDSHRHIPIR